LLGPILAGIAISAFSGLFDSTEGYAATWLVCSAAVLASLCFLRALARQQSDREQVRDSGEAS
jgi:hypothetical protein